MNDNLYEKYYVINNSMGEVLVDRETKEMIKDDSLLLKVRTSISNQRRIEFKELIKSDLRMHG